MTTFADRWLPSMTLFLRRLRQQDAPAANAMQALFSELGNAVLTPTDWTPALTFATPGDLSIAYSTQVGKYVKIGRQVTVSFTIITSTFTHTTASGNARITGLPFAMQTSDEQASGALYFSGITKATYTNFVLNAESGLSYLFIIGSGTGVGLSPVTAANMPTAGSVVLSGSITYFTAS